MGAAYFYHLTQRPLEATLPVLLEKALSAGWRVAVRGPDPERLDRLDTLLWEGPEDAFLPHGREGGPHDAMQPVLLTTSTDRPNGAVCVMAVDGAEVTPGEVQAMERVCILFDGNDEAAKEAAHAHRREMRGAVLVRGVGQMGEEGRGVSGCASAAA